MRKVLPRRPRRAKAVLFGWVVVVLLAANFLVFLLYIFAYPSELLFFVSECKKIPGVQVLDAWGNVDTSLADIWVRIDVAGKGVMRFEQLTDEAFRKTGALWLNKIGPFEIHVWGLAFRGSVGKDGVEVRSHGGRRQVNIAEDSPIPELRSLSITNVQDAVESFDDLLAVVSNWPRHPQRMDIVLRDGTVRHLSVYYDDSEGREAHESLGSPRWVNKLIRR